MKKLMVLIALIALIGSIFAIDINLSDGRKYSGNFKNIQDGMIIIIEGKVVIQIPVQEVKQIMDAGKDVTMDYMKKPLAQMIVTKPKIDDHFIQPDDFFVFTETLADNAWVYATLAKMITKPSKETKNQAEFLEIREGAQNWYSDWVSTHVATKDEIRLGAKVVFFDAMEGDVYRGPESNQEARSGWWIMSTITDLSETFKGYVLVGEGLKVSLKALRALD